MRPKNLRKGKSRAGNSLTSFLISFPTLKRQRKTRKEKSRFDLQKVLAIQALLFIIV